MTTLSHRALTSMAKAAGFDLVGFARAEPIPASVLGDWLAAGYHADLDWMEKKLAERLDVRLLLPGAKTVMALACNYWHGDEPSPIARYARGRDYHATLRDRMRRLRRAMRAEYTFLRDFGCVDAGAMMERVWAARAGLGYVGKNACFITPEYGSWVVLGAMILSEAVDLVADGPLADRCASCQLCIASCPTDAIVSPRVVDARACLSFQTIENEGPIPEALRPAMEGLVFGCDVCQSVCPLNAVPEVASARFVPRPVSTVSVAQLAAMTPEAYAQLVPGSALARAGYDGLRRNAAYALGAMREATAQPLLSKLAEDPNEVVREAARWALGRLDTATA